MCTGVLSAWMYAHIMPGAQRVSDHLELELDGCKPPYGCRELNLAPPEEQHTALLCPLSSPYAAFLKGRFI